MFSISTHHTDDCTYSYENLLAVIPNFEYNGVVLKDKQGFGYRLIIQTVQCIGA